MIHFQPETNTWQQSSRVFVGDASKKVATKHKSHNQKQTEVAASGGALCSLE